MIRPLFVRRIHLGNDDDFPVRSRERRGQRELGCAILRESQSLFVEIEWLERRRKRDRRVSRVEDLAEETRWILTENLQLQPVLRALDDVREFLALFAEQIRELHELEVEVDERVVLFGDSILDLPLDVVHDHALPL